MKFSPETLEILDNFAKVNQSILLKKDSNVLATVANNDTVLASVEVAETFPADMAIYDVGQFISIMSMFDEPTIIYSPNPEPHAVISDDAASCSYYFTDTDFVHSPDEPTLELPTVDVKFTLSAEQLEKIHKSAGILRKKFVCISKTAEDPYIWFGVRDSTAHDDNDSANEYKMIVGEQSDGAFFELVISLERLKVMKGNYEISVCAQMKFVQMRNIDKGVTYWIALNSESIYES